jgi:hypothetical protein
MKPSSAYGHCVASKANDLVVTTKNHSVFEKTLREGLASLSLGTCPNMSNGLIKCKLCQDCKHEFGHQELVHLN